LVLFGSEQFIRDFESRVNANRLYEESARNWEGDFLFVVRP